ncbi:MAG: hypothetical protein ABIZ52_05530 [Candidatus Limnocylindrales bacterium]
MARPPTSRRALTVLAVLVLVASAAAPTFAVGETLSLKPSSGLAGSASTASGAGFPDSAKVDLLWDGAGGLAGGYADKSGSFSIGFDVPKGAGPGAHKVTACATVGSACDASAAATFTVELPATPKPTLPPKPTPTPTPSSKPTAPPTAGPSATPAPSVAPTGSAAPPEFNFAPLPWQPNGSGPCTTVPFRDPTRVMFFNPAGTDTLRGASWNGTIARPPMGAQSGTLGLSSAYDDFGSTGRPIAISFGQHPESELVLYVGRETPSQNPGQLTAVLTGFWRTPTGMLQVARATTTLEAAAIPISRCLHLTAPTGTALTTITLDYFDEDGESAYERRWLDTVIARGATPGLDAGAFVTSATLISPPDGSILRQSASEGVRLVAAIRSDGFQPTVRVGLNGLTAREYGVVPSDGGDPGLWTLDITLGDGLRDDERNSLVITPSGPSATSLTSSFTLSPPVAGDVAVVGIEVNQAVQVPGNLIPLIGGKRTVVRVFLTSTPDSRGPWGQVTGELVTRRADGSTVTHAPVRTFATPGTGLADRYASLGQLVFLLDPRDVQAGALRLEARIRPAVARPQTDLANDTLATSVTFLAPRSYTAYGLVTSFPDGQTNTWSALQGFVPYVANVFPVTTAQIIPVPGMGTEPQLVGSLDLMRGLTGRILSRLPVGTSIFALWPGTEPPASACAEGVCQAGLAFIRRTDGWGNTYLGPSTMAQELAHAEGLWWHAETTGEPAAPVFPFFNPVWPSHHTDIGHVGMDTINPMAPLVIPPLSGGRHMHDYMSYASSGAPVPHWTSAYTYCDLLDHLTWGADRCTDATKNAPSKSWVDAGENAAPAFAWHWTGPDAATARLQRSAQPPGALAAGQPMIVLGAPLPERAYLLVQGSIGSDGLSGVIEPLETIHRGGDVTFDGIGDAFRLAILDGAGKELFGVPFSPFGTHLEADGERPFSFVVPAPAGARKVVVLRGDRVIAERVASANGPTIVLDGALDGTTVSNPTVLSWQAADADGDALLFSAEISTDAGATWLPIGVGLTDTNLTLDPMQVPGGANVLVRVDVTDGFLGSSATSGTFAIPLHAPEVTITSPDPDLTIEHGRPVLFEARTFDWEDQSIRDDGMAWTSDRDGDLGLGGWITAEALTVGTHIVTLTATDRDGKLSSATVRVTVTGEIDVVPEAPAPGTTTSQMSSAIVLSIAALVGAGLLGGFLFVRRRRRA